MALTVLGIDPGGFVAGWGIVRREGARVARVESGVLRMPRNRSFPQRLKLLHDGLQGVLDRHRVDCVAIEAVFHSRHARSALQLGHARGVLLLAAAQRDLPIHEYPPATVKKAVTGNGAADKEQVGAMVALLLGGEVSGPADESDALAVALCHAQGGRLLSRAKGSADVASGQPRRRLRRTKG